MLVLVLSSPSCNYSQFQFKNKEVQGIYNEVSNQLKMCSYGQMVISNSTLKVGGRGDSARGTSTATAAITLLLLFTLCAHHLQDDTSMIHQ